MLEEKIHIFKVYALTEEMHTKQCADQPAQCSTSSFQFPLVLGHSYKGKE